MEAENTETEAYEAILNGQAEVHSPNSQTCDACKGVCKYHDSRAAEQWLIDHCPESAPGRTEKTLFMNELQKIDLPPSALLERAITSGANIEVLERLMALQERWQANQAKAAFTAAMARLRLHLPVIVKNQTVDFTGSRGRTHYQYEDLHDVTEKLTPEMAKEGLSFRWRTQPGDPVMVACIISHEDGHSEECALSAPRDESGNKNAIQALGSAITYLQRYTLKAALGVAAARDDDGQGGRSPSAPLIERQENSGNLGSPIRPLTKEPLKATPKFRERIIENLQQFDVGDLHDFVAHKKWLSPPIVLDDWPLDHVPVNREQLGELIREIENFIKTKRAIAPNTAEFSEPFWNAIITVPRAGMKRVDYLQAPDTIKSLYDAMKGGDEKARARLFGMAKEWTPQEWTGQDGQLHPPSQADLDCRKALDQFLAWEDQKKSN